MTQNAKNSDTHDEVNLIDLSLIVLGHKKLVALVTFLSLALSLVIAYSLPAWYEATARILPPPEQSSVIQDMASQSLLMRLFGGGSKNDTYVGILKSRTVGDSIIQAFDLKKVYGQERMDNTRNTLTRHTKVELPSDTGIISITVEDKDPERASRMANAYVDALDRVNRSVQVSSGQLKRVFLEERIKKVMEDLAKAESALKDFRERHGIVDVDSQAKAAIDGAAKVKGDIITSTIQLEVLKRFHTDSHNEVVSVRSRIRELNRQLSLIEKGVDPRPNEKRSSATESEGNFHIPFSEMPNLSMQLATLMREAKVQEEVYRLITAQYEMAKIEESKDIKTVQVLDLAVTPDKRSWPDRKLIAIGGLGGGFLLAVLLSFLLEFNGRLKVQDPVRYGRITSHIRFRHKRDLSTQTPLV